MKRHLYVFFYVIIFLSLLACDADPTELPTMEEDYHQVLAERLLEASGGIGKDFYLLDQANIPEDPRNPLNQDKIKLGMLLFHETGIALRPKAPHMRFTYSCASCHNFQAGFQAAVAQGIGDGGIGFGVRGERRRASVLYDTDSVDVQALRSPTIVNSAFQENMLWNGSMGSKGANVGTENNWMAGSGVVFNNLGFEGLETQALAAINIHRLDVNRPLFEAHYKELFERAFPEESGNRYTRINMALAMAAYERAAITDKAPFQKWLRGNENAMSEDQIKGAILFFGKGGCYQCHNGPSLAKNEFFAIGMDDLQKRSNIIVLDTLAVDEVEVANRGRGGFTFNPQENFCFKVPQLYNLKDSPFYGHGASFESIREVIVYKNEGRAENEAVPSSQLSPLFEPLGLSDEEVTLLTVFLEEALHDAELQRYAPMELPSGNCFPNADPESMEDLGCS